MQLGGAVGAGNALDMMIVGGLVVMGLVTVLFYLVRRRDPTPLWLGLFCVVLAGHFLYSDPPTAVRFVCWYLSLPLLALFVRSLHPNETSQRVVKWVIGLGVAGSLATIAIPAQRQSFVIGTMEIVTVAASAWLVFILASAAWRKRALWTAILAGMPLMYPLMMVDLPGASLLRLALLPAALLPFVVAPVVVLALRIAEALEAGEMRSEQARGRLSELDQALRNQSKLTHDLVNSVPVGLALRDPDGRYLFVNDTWIDWFGGPREKVIGALMQDRVPPEDAGRIAALDRAVLERGVGAAPQVNEIEYGGRRLTQMRSVMADEQGKVIGILIGSMDITERHLQERRLHDQMVLTKALIDENPNAMYLKDTSGRYVTVNDAWLKMVGKTREEALGKNVLELFADAPSEGYHAVDMELLAQGHGSSEVESLRTGPDGKPQWLIVRKAVLRRADGEVIGLIGVNTDITPLKRYEAQLAERNKFITEVIEALPVSFVIRDTQGRHLQVNRAWERYYNVKREQVIGKRFIEFPGWKDDPELVEFAKLAERLDRETLARGPDDPLEPMERHRKGRTYLNTRRVIVDASGWPAGIVGVSLDITEQRALAESLALEQRRTALVVRATHAGIVDWDGHTHGVYYSPRFKEMLGHAPDADTSNWPDYFKELLHPDDRAEYTAKWQAFLKGKGAAGPRAEFLGPDEHRLQRADGSYVWVEVSGVAVREESGFVARWIAAVTDITERRAQDQLLEENQRELAAQKTILETTLDNIDQGITMIDRDLRIIAFNRRFLELLDFPAEFFAGGRGTLEQALRYNAERGEYGPGDVEEQVARRLELARKFEPHAFERKRPGGQVLAIRGQPLPGGGGFVTTYSDVTEQKRAEEELRASVALREEVERMSRHDLKTPIHSVIAVSRLLRENSRLSRDDALLLATVERAGYRILNMVNLSLDLFRMEQGTYEFRPHAVDLDEVAAKVATDLQGQAASKQVHVRVTRRQPATARAEELLCYSIFGNLVKNAIEAAPEGTTVTVELDREGDWVVARVHNPGAVPDEVRPRFFEKYATSGKSTGLGLGTYSAQLLARVQGGTVDLETNPDQGTTLILRLKAAQAEDAPARREIAPQAAAATPAPSPELPALRVLVADDDEFNRLVLRRYLPSPPLRVTMAVNGRAAIDAANEEWPDVVLLDLEMPVMDGYETAATLRRIEHERHKKPVLIVAISSNDEEAIVQRALAAGCNHYLVKPARREMLWQILAGASVPLASGGLGPAHVDSADEVELDPDLESALPRFLASRREALAEMPVALAAGDRDTFKRLAHRLAGSFALYGFRWAATEAKALERDAAEGEADDLATRTEALRAHLDVVKVRVAAKDPVTP